MNGTAVVVSINKNVSWQRTQHQEACNLYLIIFAYYWHMNGLIKHKGQVAIREWYCGQDSYLLARGL